MAYRPGALGQSRGFALRLILPDDVVAADRLAADAATRVIAGDDVPEGWMGLDIGPRAAQAYAARIAAAGEVFWNGPMGMFEMAPFAAGTETVARAMAASRGSPSWAAATPSRPMTSLGLAEAMDHVSTGGGASLEFIEGGDPSRA